MALRCARAAKIFAMHTKPHSAKKPLRNAWNHASAIAMTLRTHDVFHRRCGCSAGEPVEKTLKCLTALKHAHAAKVLLASRGRQRLCTYAPLPRRHDGWRCILAVSTQRFSRPHRVAPTGQNVRSACATQRHQSVAILFHRLTRGTSTAPVENTAMPGMTPRCVRPAGRVVERRGGWSRGGRRRPLDRERAPSRCTWVRLCVLPVWRSRASRHTCDPGESHRVKHLPPLATMRDSRRVGPSQIEISFKPD